MHLLRHAYASLLAEAGADPAYLMTQIGHRNAYTHVQNRKKNATAALDALIRTMNPPQWAPLPSHPYWPTPPRRLSPKLKPPRLQRFLRDGARRARTADLLGAIQALSQLSYSPVQGTV